MPSSPEAGRAWIGLAALLAAGAAASWFADSQAIDWQPALARREPWRAWSAAFVHFSGRHLAANLAGAALVGAFGWFARLPWRSVAAWASAWPLTQLGLLARPDLLHYGGLSGVLHAGLACAALQLVVGSTRARRAIGSVTLVVLAGKVVSESPWGAALRHPAGWDIAVAPFAHASGLLAGGLVAAVLETVHLCRRRAATSERDPPRRA